MMRTVTGIARYLAVAALTFAVIVVAYVLFVDRAIVGSRPIVPVYSQLLLEATADIPDKIVIVGGSSSHYGLDAAQLSREFGRLVVNLAERGSVPLSHYLHTVEPALNKGDTLLLPVEWVYYTKDNRIGQDYVKAVMHHSGTLKTLYTKQSLFERIRMILSATPLNLVSKEFLQEMFTGDQDMVAVNRAVLQARQLSQGTLSTVLGSVEPGRAGDPRWDTIMRRLGCDRFIFGVDEPGDVHLDDTFRRTVSWLAEHVQKKGVRVLFTWPPVADPQQGQCYTAKWRGAAQRLEKQVRELLQQYGMTMAGNWSTFHYSRDCRLDSSYHLVEVCRERHTERVAQALHTAGFESGEEEKWSEKQVRVKVSQRVNRLTYNISNKIPILDDITSSKLTSRALFSIGWSWPESWGIWSNGTRSEFIVKLSKTDRAIHIKGQYFGVPENTRVKVNGVDVGQYDLRDARIPVVNPDDNGLVRIALFHKNPTIPKTEMKYAGLRRIKYGIETVSPMKRIIEPLPAERWTSNLPKYILFAGGWSHPEPWGIWSEGGKSRFYISVPEGANALEVAGRYFGSPEHTKVLINGHSAGRYDLRHAVIPLNLPERSGLVQIELLHENPIAPRDIDPGATDSRKIKYGLKSVCALWNKIQNDKISSIKDVSR